MTSLELNLKRTLTDVLEDELYHINCRAGEFGSNSFGNTYAVPGWAGDSTSELVGGVDHDTALPGAGMAYNSIFSRYADPNLTTTTAAAACVAAASYVSGSAQSPGGGAPSGTVNLNSVLHVPNPFIQAAGAAATAAAAGSRGLFAPAQFDVKIFNDYTAAGNVGGSVGGDDDFAMIPEEDFFEDKASYPLQDNTLALNNEDAKMKFDEEFTDDEDDEDEDENLFEDDGTWVQDSFPAQPVPRQVHSPVYYMDGAGTESALYYSDDDDDDTGLEVLDDVGPQRELLGETDKALTAEDTERSQSIVLREKPKVERPTARRRSHHHHHSSATGATASGEIFTCRLASAAPGGGGGGGVPCGASFSRIYDLTRHQNTIHAKKRSVFRCTQCIALFGDEGYAKTFSRLDALTRHIKSKHEELTPEEVRSATQHARQNMAYVAG
ncbi:stress-regulated transcription factor RPN4 KNAG_0K01703 [Huiozyma naganishii CBS 8797]|uniref:C2H2-type domain-containing protein n=1 Tax=Huiozyma naganishii (strain ATCC MYA-139 / BCRC 22969 / CBS 8797 / KCTC 17520 / NBRC 10181 / NCYC 3082 / Yp74L-3) TaxID=1071383 RepID=J7SA88_HUIN7|nr:hypothetical protein KNAG_0K01703 [Kazachstania naganishii CBS 8797]CCK72534.1 hypothetical protein KNAG_0K01703 [Kazachstania naganishii CBS 8797]